MESKSSRAALRAASHLDAAQHLAAAFPFPEAVESILRDLSGAAPIGRSMALVGKRGRIGPRQAGIPVR